jgi:hypothetical protein
LSTFTIENGFRTKIEQLGGEQVDDLGLDVAASGVEFHEQAPRMSLDVALVFVE